MSRILCMTILTAPSTQDIDSYDHHVSCMLPTPTTTHGETCRADARVLFVLYAVLMFWSVDVVLKNKIYLICVIGGTQNVNERCFFAQMATPQVALFQFFHKVS